MGAHSCHTKAVLIDDRMSIVGSYNMDMRSTYQDTELMLAVDCPELNSIIQTKMERDKTYSKTMGNDGEYDYGENYHSKDLSFGKKDLLCHTACDNHSTSKILVTHMVCLLMLYNFISLKHRQMPPVFVYITVFLTSSLYILDHFYPVLYS